MSGGGHGEEAATLEFTPTWVVAAVCTIIIAISLALERFLHLVGKYLKKKNQKPLFQALQKVKEELMLLGFISLLLTVFQGAISKICVHGNVLDNMLPCDPNEVFENGEKEPTHHSNVHLLRHLLADAGEAAHSELGYCAQKGKVPLLSLEALHHLHIFIFVLAIVHVTFCVLTIVFGTARIHRWKHWEDSIAKANEGAAQGAQPKLTHVHHHAFIKEHFQGIGKDSKILGWVSSFMKQFFGSVTKADYETLRLGFITTHCRGNPKFNFHRYLLRALEDDFKKVVGISWYLWAFVILFLLLNINGWHTYFWIAFIPFVLLLAVGTKLEHVISQLANEVAEKHVAIEGDLVVQPSDEHFWFGKPRLVLFLIHIILFQNAFEIAFFFWIWVQYGFHSCIMGQIRYIIPRLVLGVIIQVLCSYSTLPLYALVTQMGSSFKKSIFEEHVQVGLVGWAQKVKQKNAMKMASNGSGQGSSNGSSVGIQLGKLAAKASTPKPASEGSQ